jgi:hypothetical protein
MYGISDAQLHWLMYYHPELLNPMEAQAVQQEWNMRNWWNSR